MRRRAKAAVALGAGAGLDLRDLRTVSAPRWWFNLRPSNTEPLLRLNVEADTEELMSHIRDTALAAIREGQ